MQLTSDSFTPYSTFDARLAFGKHDPDTHFTFAGNRNPHLRWSDVPEGTKSFALLCWDPDVPTVGDDVNQEGKSVPLNLPRTDFFHWVVCDLPADLREIAEGSHSDGVVARGKPAGPTPDGGLQGANDFTGWFADHADMGGTYCGYDGMAPPWNDERMHGYRFGIYALDVETLGLTGAFTGGELQQAIAQHAIGAQILLGLYAINPNPR